MDYNDTETNVPVDRASMNGLRLADALDALSGNSSPAMLDPAGPEAQHQRARLADLLSQLDAHGSWTGGNQDDLAQGSAFTGQSGPALPQIAQQPVGQALTPVTAGGATPGANVQSQPLVRGRITGLVPSPPEHVPPPGILLPTLDSPPAQPPQPQEGIGDLILDGVGEAAKGIARGLTGALYRIHPPHPTNIETVTDLYGGIPNGKRN